MRKVCVESCRRWPAIRLARITALSRSERPPRTESAGSSGVLEKAAIRLVYRRLPMLQLLCGPSFLLCSFWVVEGQSLGAARSKRAIAQLP